MNRKAIKMQHRGVYFLFALILCAFALSSCNQDDDIIKPPTGDPTNQTPKITSMSSNTTWVEPDKVATLYCDAYDPDGDTLSYLWSCVYGSIESDDTLSWVYWKGPTTVGNYVISVKVSDGEDYDSSGISIEVK